MMCRDIVETETQEQPEVPEVVNIPKSTLRVSLSNAEIPQVDKCCFVFNLSYGLIAWLSFEAVIWTFFFISTLCYLIVLVNEVDLMELSDIMNMWHFKMMFGNRIDCVDAVLRTHVILIYLLLTLFFLIYVTFCIILIFGIHFRKTCFFIPYFTLDGIFFAFALIGCFTGLIISYDHLFRICLLFLIIKTYVEVCVVSLFIQVRHEKSKLSTPEELSGVVFQDSQASAV